MMTMCDVLQSHHTGIGAASLKSESCLRLEGRLHLDPKRQLERTRSVVTSRGMEVIA